MGLARGSLTLPRMNAHRLVIVAAALTTVVAAALATTLAVFGGQALPRAVRHNLANAGGTTLVISGSVDAGQAAQFSSMLPGEIRSALEGTPFAFYRADWSDPLGFVAGSLPAPPASAGNVPIAEAAALSGIEAHAVLLSGSWPGAPQAGQPLPAALPATTAAALHVTDGDLLRMRDQVSKRLLRFRITGLYRPGQLSGASAGYWGLDDIGLSGSRTDSGFTTYGPLTVQAAAFAGPLAVNMGSWLAEPETASIPADSLSTVAANVTGLGQALLSSDTVPDLTLTTSLPSVLNGTASNLAVARSLLAICAVLLLLLAAAALLVMARLLADQREGESAMLAARGASRWQLARLTAAEAIPLCVVAAVAGGLAGILLARLLASTGSMTTELAGAWPAVAVVAAGALVIMLMPVLRTVTPGAARARRGRQAAISGLTRAGADLALVLLAVLAGWQLRHYSAASAGASGSFGVDPVIAVAPALALAGGTVAALRLLPAGGKAGDRLAARGRGLTAALASWQISRQPIRQGGAALLIVLAVATGTLALAQRQSWTDSDHDQAAFSAGADVRVQTTEPLTAAQAGALVRVPGVRHAMPVAAFPQYAIDGETLAIDASQAADVSLLRADQSPLPAARLFTTIRPSTGGHGVPGTEQATGLTLPARTAEVRLTGRLGPPSPQLAPVMVSVSVEDADGDVYQVQAGTLLADGRDHTLTAVLTSGAGEAIYPLRLTAITVSYTLPAMRPRAPATFVVDSLSGGPGTAQLPGADLLGWTSRASSPELSGVRETIGTNGPSSLPVVLPTRAAGGQPDAFGDVQPRLRDGRRGFRYASQLRLRPAGPHRRGPRPGRRPWPRDAAFSRRQQRERRVDCAGRHQRHHHQREGGRGGADVPHRVRQRGRPDRGPGHAPGHPDQRLAGTGPGDAVVAGHHRAANAAGAGGQPAARLRRHQLGRPSGGAGEQSAFGRAAAGAARRRRRRRTAGHHRVLREHRRGRPPASRGKRAARRPRSGAARGGQPARPGKAHAEPAVGAGRPRARRRARRTARTRHYPHHVGDQAGAASAHPVRVGADAGAGAGGGRTPRARGVPHHRAAAGPGRRTARRGGGMSRIPGLGRIPSLRRVPGLGGPVGSAADGTLALALLVCGCVFAALAGPALSLHTRTQALNQTLAALGGAKTVQVSDDWGDFTGPLAQTGESSPNLTETQLTESTSEIGRSLAATPLPLAAGAWAGLSTNKPLVVTSGAAATAQAGAPPRLEVVYRDPLTSNARLVAGTYATTAVPAGVPGTVPVTVTTQTAARFGLHPGSRLQLTTPTGAVTLVVTAILRERAPGSTFWTADTTAGTPSLVTPPPSARGGLPYWAGGVFADPGALAAMQNALSGPGLAMQWEFPLAAGGVNADQAQGLSDDLNRASTTTPALTGDLSAAAATLMVSSPLAQDLSAFLDTQAAIQTVLLLLFVSMIVVGVAVILVAATTITARRADELTVLRARGGSLRQVAALMLRRTAIASVPAALVGAGLAIALIPGTSGQALIASPMLGWWLAGITVLAALAGPPLIAAWQHRRPAPASNPARITTAETARSPMASLRRPVAEVTACAASVAGLVVLHDQGLPAGGSIDLYLAAVPVLVAIPVVVIMLRLYPLVIRGLLRLSARRAGATGFVALAAAARTSLTGVLPAFALVLALSLATFAGALGDAITRGEIAASWQTTGADVLIRPDRGRDPGDARSGAGDRGGARRAQHDRGLDHHLDNAGRAAADGGSRGSGQLRDRGRGYTVPPHPGGEDRRRIRGSAVPRCHRTRARVAVGGRQPGRGGGATYLAVSDGTDQGAGRR